MAADIYKLVTVEQQINETALAFAERLLDDIRTGKVDSFVAVGRCTAEHGGGFCDYHSGAMNYPEMVGLIEIAKLSWAASYLSANAQDGNQSS